MHVEVNATRLWFDVTGASLVPDGPRMRSRPTVVLLHGGPGSYDHSYLKPDFDQLAQVAQVVYLDLRGHGRSSWHDTDTWTFEACADDVRAFCDALGIASPVVLGHSMGAPVALLYAARHQGHASGIVALAGFARWDPARLVQGFRARAGTEVAALAGRSYAGEDVSDEEWQTVFAAFGPHLPDPDRRARTPKNLPLGERGMALIRGLDIRDQLSRVTCPTLVAVGALDPITPPDAAEEIVRALPASLSRLEVLEAAGHFPWLDAPERLWPTLVDFIGATPIAPRG